MPQAKPKIALVGNTLSGGGAERVQARLSFFFEANGIAVHHILVTNEITYPYAGKVFNMGLLKNEANGPWNKLKRLQALRAYLKKEKFDFIIDFRVKHNWFQEYLIANWIYQAPYVMSIRSFHTDYYFPKDIKKAKSIFKKAYGITTVSKALQHKIENEYGYKNVETIYNPLEIASLQRLGKEPIDVSFQYILGIGRMQSTIKQFDHLIEAYVQSKAREHHTHLLILGEGEDLASYQTLVETLGIEDWVHFVPFTENPHPYFKNAYLTALTSKYEGFPNILLESLVQGTPVVSYNCESGPNEIIEEGVNGLLVENQSPKAMASALDTMITDKQLYKTCSEAAVGSIQRFELNVIGEQWLDFLKLR